MTRSYNALPAGNRLAPAPMAPAQLPAMPQAPMEQWGPPPPPPSTGMPAYQRYLAAISRFKWLVLGMVILGLIAGYVATRYVKPEYEVQGKVTLRDPTAQILGNERQRSNESFVQSFRSFYLSDSVTRSLKLYLKPKREADASYFRDFTLADRFVPGLYELTTDAKKEKYVLRVSRKGDSRELERGAVGDSIGRTSGLRWRPGRDILPAKASIEFEIKTPREASIDLQKKLRADAPLNTDIMNISLRGEDASRTEMALNMWMDLFVRWMGVIRNGGASQSAGANKKAYDDAQERLQNARRELQTFRIGVITLPGEQVSIAPGIGATESQTLGEFTRSRLSALELRNDRQFLESMVRSGVTAENASNALFLNSVTGPGGEQLKGALTEFYKRNEEYRAKQLNLTDDHPDMVRMRDQITRLEANVIPRLVRSMITSLKAREDDFDRRVAQQASEIRNIPARTIKEEELRSTVSMQEEIVRNLGASLERERLREAATRNEVFVQDSAIAPLRPTTNTALQIIPAGVALGLVLGLGLAILIDLLDKRVRYPEQVAKDLELEIIGAIPLVHPGRPSVEEQAQLVESFRTLRLSLRHQFAAGEPVSFTVTSTGPSEGKSFVSSNLALSFAEAGFRTVLVDGDTRRGAVQQAFGVPSKPGLVDFLQGNAALDDVAYSTSYDRLSLVPCGSRHRQAPEMVTTAAMESLLDELRARFDVVIVDSPPLGAGTDAYALATLTGGLLMVLRVGVTDRKMAIAKLETMDRLPIRPLGAVLNGIEPKGVFQYYHYLEGYNAASVAGETRSPLLFSWTSPCAQFIESVISARRLCSRRD
jgi:polysaccharide biosynthesis transport protein